MIDGHESAAMDADESDIIQRRLEILERSADELYDSACVQRDIIPLRFDPVNLGLIQEAQAATGSDRNSRNSFAARDGVLCLIRVSNEPGRMDDRRE
jgi:hypothetical protein